MFKANCSPMMSLFKVDVVCPVSVLVSWGKHLSFCLSFELCIALHFINRLKINERLKRISLVWATWPKKKVLLLSWFIHKNQIHLCPLNLNIILNLFYALWSQEIDYGFGVGGWWYDKIGLHASNVLKKRDNRNARKI